MKYFYAGAMLLACTVLADAQTQKPQQPQVTFTITVTAQELDLIGNGLGSMPFKDAAPLINSLREQVIAQTKPKDEKPVEEKK